MARARGKKAPDGGRKAGVLPSKSAMRRSIRQRRAAKPPPPSPPFFFPPLPTRAFPHAFVRPRALRRARFGAPGKNAPYGRMAAWLPSGNPRFQYHAHIRFQIDGRLARPVATNTCPKNFSALFFRDGCAAARSAKANGAARILRHLAPPKIQGCAGGPPQTNLFRNPRSMRGIKTPDALKDRAKTIASAPQAKGGVRPTTRARFAVRLQTRPGAGSAGARTQGATARIGRKTRLGGRALGAGAPRPPGIPLGRSGPFPTPPTIWG